MSKVISITLALILSPLLLTSCFRSEQLNERMLVQAVGVDLVEGEIEITLQVYAPATQGGSGISATSDNAKIVTATGKTITQAIQNATLTQGKTVFMGHNRVIVIGDTLAKDGMLPTLDYFSSNASSRHNINVIIASDTASEILKTKLNQGIVPAETIEKMITRANEIGLLKNVKLYELLSTLQNDFESATLPIIEISKEEETQQASAEPSSAEESGENPENSSQNELDNISTLKVSGTGILKDGRLENTLNLQETRGLLFILNEVKDTTLTVSTEDYNHAAVQIYSSSSTLTPTMENGSINFHLEITSQASLGQRELNSTRQSNEEAIQQLEVATAKIIEEECTSAYVKAITITGADIFDFGHIMWQRNPNIWKTVKDDWKTQVNNISFTVNSNVIINRVGLEL